MSSLSGFSESAGSSSSSVRAMSRVSGSGNSPLISEEESGNGGAEAFEQPTATGMLPSKIAESNLPRRQGYEWASSLVTSRFSRYRWSSMVSTYAIAVPMFSSGKTSLDLFAERCTPVDNVCHGREGHGHDFFYIYPCMFTDSNIRLPFDDFTMGVLRMLNVTPTQLHPNSWASLQGFRLLAEMFHLRPSPHIFLSYYSTCPSYPVKWVSLVSQSHNVPFTPFSSSYKYFKDSFFKIVITVAGRQHIFYGDTPKFPLYWTRDPVYYLSWPRSPVTEDDKRMFEIMDQLPWKLNVCSILKLYHSSHRWVDLYNMFGF